MKTPNDCPQIHELKTWPEMFEPLRRGQKTHEFRINDRGFAVGDLLILREWCPVKKDYTGRAERRTVTFIAIGGTFGIPAGYCVMSLATDSDAGTIHPQELLPIIEELKSLYPDCDCRSCKPARDLLSKIEALIERKRSRALWI